MGKTNTPELTLGIEMTNEIYGPTFNPYDLTKSPGGSSGGAAAIVAAGGSVLDLGSDTGGSIREPAHFCGITGLKPTFGRVPRTGHSGPWELNIWDQLTQIGPMARYVEDLQLVLKVIMGEDGIDPTTVNRTVHRTRMEDVKNLRIAVYTDAEVLAPIEPITNSILNAARTLEDSGARVTYAYPDALKEVTDLYLRYTYANLGPMIIKTLNYYHTSIPGKHLVCLLDKIKNHTPVNKQDLDAELAVYRQRMNRFMDEFDLIICPANVTAAVGHAAGNPDYNHDAWFNLYAYNLTGWPAAVIRQEHTNNNLPVGIQIVGRPWREDQVLAVAG